ncbi:MAG: hypothetical protein GWP74_00420, partial [Proteobacteria bacterium]|nr:hypothetical protein [Pseudomonadota bacterium]
MGKDTTTDRDHSVTAADKKVARKKVAKKTSKKKAVGAKKKSKASKATPRPASVSPAAAVSPEPPAASAPRAAFSPPAEDEPRPGSGMRGIVALWGPLAIIVLLIVVSRIGDDDPGVLSERAADGLSASLESVESLARDVVEDVQDALTGGDPQVAAALGTRVPGQGPSGSPGSDLAAAFNDTGAISGAPKSAATTADPWAQSEQTTTPASVSA